MIGPAADGLAATGLVAHGTWHRNSWIFAPALRRPPGDENLVSITFDGLRARGLGFVTLPD